MRIGGPVAAAILLGLVLPVEGGQPDTPVRTYRVPYRQTDTKHVLIRAKINGKGPFNFILDTGAPTLYLSTAAARQLGIKPDRKGWAALERFELEGGLIVPRVRGRVEDPFQLEAMNGLGVAGVRLDGILGYSVVARYRLELDFTRDTLGWTPLNFEPPAPLGMDAKAEAPAGLDAMAGALKALGAFLKKKPSRELAPRGFLGVELADASGGIEVMAVLAGSPAAKAGVRVGDRIRQFQGLEVRDRAALQQQAATLRIGETVRLGLTRAGAEISVTFPAGEGL